MGGSESSDQANVGNIGNIDKSPIKVSKEEAINKLNQNIHFGSEGTSLFTEVIILTKG